jgi:hypothetical protein
LDGAARRNDLAAYRARARELGETSMKFQETVCV